MKRFLIALMLLSVVALGTPADAYTLSGHVTGGQAGFTLKYVFAVPVTLDTVYLTIAIPILNTYTIANIAAGGYVLFAYQDLNTNLTPDLDEPRGFYGGEIPMVFELLGDSSGVDIELHASNQGGFSGTISYAGTQTGATLIYASYTPDFAGLPHGGSVLFNNTGNGDYVALVDSFTTYYAVAYMDLNNNFTWDAGEPRGIYGGETPAPIIVQQGSAPTGIDIVMVESSWSFPVNPMKTQTFALNPVYPNPFNSTATIVFSVDGPETIELALFDALGRRVAVLASGPVAAGEHRVSLEAGELATGMYFVRLSGQQGHLSRPVLLLR